MLIDNESIIIFEGSICSRMASGEITADVMQKIKVHDTAGNGFIRNGSVIQCISTAPADGEGKLKFSVMYKPVPCAELESAAIVFSSGSECRYEIRCQNETTAQGSAFVSAAVIRPSDLEGKLILEFSDGQVSGQDDIMTGLSSLSADNQAAESEISVLEQELSSEQEKSRILIEKKEIVTEKLEAVRAEAERADKDIREYEELTAAYDAMQKNIAENGINQEKLQSLRKQLECFENILGYYKNENGYDTVADKLSDIISQADAVGNLISELADKRTAETESITEQ